MSHQAFATTADLGQVGNPSTRVIITEPDFWTTVELVEEQGYNLCPMDLPRSLHGLRMDQIIAITELSACVRWEPGGKPKGWKNEWLRSQRGTWHGRSAALRSELAFEGLVGHPGRFGYISATNEGDWAVFVTHDSLGLSVSIVCDDRYPVLPDDLRELPPKRLRGYFDPSHVEALVPKRHRHLSLHTLTPKTLRTERGIGIPLDRQQVYIDKTRALDPWTLCGWLILGPGAGSKTTLQATWLKDEVTIRSIRVNYQSEISGEPEHGHICVWSINAGSWLNAVEDWYETPVAHRIDADRPLLPDTIKKTCGCTKLRPILWIEELQGMELTLKRIKWLHNLLDAVYCEEGLIMANTNWTKEELSKHLPEATRRRITGEGEGDRKHLFQSWDFHKAAEVAVPHKIMRS